MVVSTRSLYRLLFLGAAATFSLFGFNQYRVTLIYDIPVPILFLIPIFIFGILTPSMLWGKLRVNFSPRQYKTLALLSLLFFLWHIMMIIPSWQKTVAVKEACKLGVGLLSFWTILAIFPRDQKFLERFWRIAIWSVALLLLYLLYMNIFVLHRAFFTIDLTERGSREGRNIVSWLVAVMLPFAYFNFWMTRRKFIASLPLICLVVTSLYLSSRSAWIAASAAILSGCLVAWRINKIAGFRLTLGVLIVAPLTVATGFWLLSQADFISLDEIHKRFVYIYDPEAVPELHSYTAREERIGRKWKDFLTSPIIGQGLGTNNWLSHNDYISILAEMGVIGTVLFLAILFIFGNACFGRLTQRISPITWVPLAVRCSFVSTVLLFGSQNVYTSARVWIFWALILVALEIERRQAQFNQQTRGVS